MKITKRSAVAISHDFTKRDGQLILSSLNHEYLKKTKVIAKCATEIISISFLKTCRMICSSKLLSFPLTDLVERISKKDYQDPLLAFWPIKQCFESELFDIACKPLPPLLLLNREKRCQANKSLSEKMKCKTPLAYYCLHLEILAIQLASVVLHFDKFCFDKFKLSPLHCPSLPSYSYCVAMERSKASYQYVKDEEMIEFIEAGIRGPIETSNIKITKDRDSTMEQPDTQIMLVDYTSFYPTAYSNALPTGDYEWLSDEEISKLSLDNVPEDVGYLLSVDISTPDHLMDELDCLPLAPCKKRIDIAELSAVQVEAVNNSSSGRKGLGNEMLSLDFYPKSSYVVYHKTLLYYMSRGMILHNVNKGIKFKQAAVLQEFSFTMTELRQELKMAGDLLGAMIIKQMLCFFFGRMPMNDKSFTNIRVCVSKKDCIRQAALHTFSDVTVLSPNCSLFHHTKCSIRYSSPLLWGQVCLDLSKIELYEGLRHFKRTFPGTKLILAQTDSLLLKIPAVGDNLVSGLKALDNIFDFSSLPTSHSLYDSSKQGKAGLWKIVDMDISEVISIKTCVYSYLLLCDKCKEEFNKDCSRCIGKTSTPGLPDQYKNLANHSYFRQLVKTHSAEQVNVQASGVYSSVKFGFHNLNVRRYLNNDGNTSTAFNNVILRNGASSV
jgi:hypothetical protein